VALQAVRGTTPAALGAAGKGLNDHDHDHDHGSDMPGLG
jgi:hypothetical protein